MEMKDRIRYLRKEHKLTQKELAEMLGLKTQAICKYEKGNVTNIKRETIEKMSQIFNVRATYILGYDDYSLDDILGTISKRNKEIDYEFFNRYIDLTDEQINILILTIEQFKK